MTKKKLAQGIVKGRYVLLALMAVCTVLSVLSIEKTRINYDLTRYLSDNTMTKKALKIMEEEFGVRAFLPGRPCAERCGKRCPRS